MDFRDQIRQTNTIMEAAQNIPMGKPFQTHAVLTEAAAVAGTAKNSRKFKQPELSDSDKVDLRRKVKKLFENTEPDFVVSPVSLKYKLHEAVNSTIFLSADELTSVHPSYLTECLSEKKEAAFNWISTVITEASTECDEGKDGGKIEGEGARSVESDLDNILGTGEGGEQKEEPKKDEKDPLASIPEVDPSTVTVVTVDDETKEDVKPGEAKPEAKSEDSKEDEGSAVKELSERVVKIEDTLDQLLGFFEKLAPFEEAEHKIDLDGDGKINKGKEGEEEKPTGTLTEGEDSKEGVALKIATSIANGVKPEDPELATAINKYRSLSVVTEGEYGLPDAKIKLPTEPAHKKGDAQETAKPAGGDQTSQSVIDNEEKSEIPVPPLGKSNGLASKNNEGHHGEVTPLHADEGSSPRGTASKPMTLPQAYALFESVKKLAASRKGSVAN